MRSLSRTRYDTTPVRVITKLEITRILFAHEHLSTLLHQVLGTPEGTVVYTDTRRTVLLGLGPGKSSQYPTSEQQCVLKSGPPPPSGWRGASPDKPPEKWRFFVFFVSQSVGCYNDFERVSYSSGVVENRNSAP